MKKILLLLVLLLVVSSVSAGSVNYDYQDVTYATTRTAATSLTYPHDYAKVQYIHFNEILNYAGLETVVMGFHYVAGYGPYLSTKPNWVSKTTPVDLKIGSTVVGNGEVTVTNVANSEGILTGNIYVLEVYEWDVSGLSGSKNVEIIDTGDQGLLAGLVRLYYCTTTYSAAYYEFPDDTNYGVYPCCTYSVLKYPTQDVDITAYNNVTFHQYMYYEATSKGVDVTFSRHGFTNLISVLGTRTDTLLYNNKLQDDFELSFYEKPIWVNVTNPYTNEIWSNEIPEGSALIPPEQTALIHSYVYDAVTRNLIGNGHNVTVTYDDSSGSETYWPGGVSHTTIDWSGNSYVNFSVSSSGYSDSAVTKFVSSSLDTSGTWLPVGAEVTNSIYLNPIGTPSNTTAYATFEVREQLSGETYFYSSGAAVTVGNTTLVTSGPGSCSFELTAGTYQYTVKKTGFQTVSGSFSLGASNQYIYVELPKIPTAPTPTGAAGVDYPYTDVDPRAQAEESVGIIFDSLPSWAALCVIVVTVSFIGWMSPKKGKR